jgi:hypothetical protein
MGKVVKADSRGRISLTRQLAGPPHPLYLLEEFPDGTLVLTPAQALPATQAPCNPAAMYPTPTGAQGPIPPPQ